MADDGLTPAERNALKWIAVKEKFQKTDNGCNCATCNMVRLMLATEESENKKPRIREMRRIR